MDQPSSSYSSLFTSGLQAATGGQGTRSYTSLAYKRRVKTPIRQQSSSQQFLQPPSNPHAPSTSRHGAMPGSPIPRKIRSSLTMNASSPLAGIKTPNKAAGLAARLQSMALSPSRVQNRPPPPVQMMAGNNSLPPPKPRSLTRYVSIDIMHSTFS